LENLITVMATTCDDLVPAFSNYGTARIDLAAPGEGLSSTRRIYSTVLHKRWGHLAGTSMSTAFVAGAAALVLEPSLSSKPYEPKQIKCWLNYTAMKLAGLAGKNKSGGRLDLAAAVKPLDESRCRR
jgi:subtilisin family serine protease